MTHTSSHRPPALILKVCLATFVLALGIAGTAQAATYNVTRTDDPSPGSCDAGDCSLREAVIAANGGAEDTINVPAGSYDLTRSGSGTTRGDLDLSDTDLTTIVGAGSDATIVKQLDKSTTDGRVLDLDSDGTTADVSGLTLAGGRVNPNGGSEDGGGVQVDGTLTLSNSVVRDNEVLDFEDGGGIELRGSNDTLNLNNSLVTGNFAEDQGGGIESDGTLNVTDSDINDNRSEGGDGGGIDDDGATITLLRSTVDGNRTLDSFQDGGGIEDSSGGSTTITESTISRNRSTDDAGGIDKDSGSNEALTIVNSTISGNRAPGTSGDGGGIDSGDSGLSLLNSTVANNRADDDAGGIDDAAEVQFKNTIVANNTAGDEGQNCRLGDPPTGSQGHNLENPVPAGTDPNETCGFTTGTDLRADPVLGPLQNNGGPTETHALLSGSPAINSADNAACPATDQRGVSRPQEGTCDRGSYEVQPAAAAPPPAGPAPLARDTRRPRVSVAGLRRACVSRNFRVRVRLRDESPLRRVHVYLDGRRIVNTTRKSFRVTVRASRLRAGRHRIVIIARDVAGNRTRTVRRFRVCAARKVRRAPRFTG